MWVFVILLSGIVLAQLDALAAWDRRQNRWWLGRGRTKSVRKGENPRPLDPLVETARTVIGWVTPPDRHEYYRKKHIRFVIFLVLAALAFTIAALF